MSAAGDVIGLRVTVDSLAKVYAAVRYIRDEANTLGIKVVKLDDKNDKPGLGGYRAVHLDIEIGGKRAELQVRTINQSRFAGWAHDTIYKGAMKSSKVAQDYATRVSDALYKMDKGRQVRLPECPPPVAPHCFAG